MEEDANLRLPKDEAMQQGEEDDEGCRREDAPLCLTQLLIGKELEHDQSC